MSPDVVSKQAHRNNILKFADKVDRSYLSSTA